MWCYMLFSLVAFRMIHCATKVIGYNEIQDLEQYKQYFSVAVIHFKIPSDVQNVSFVFDAVSHKTSNIPYECRTFDVSVCMKQGALPVISPEQSSFPATFVNITSRPLITYRDFKANHKKEYINITSPTPGEWFGLAYRSWEHPMLENIGLQDIDALCKCTLHSYAIATFADVQPVDLATVHKIAIPFTYYKKILKFDSSNKDFSNIQLSLILLKCTHCTPIDVNIYIQALAIPTEEEYLSKTTLNPNGTISFTDVISLQIHPVLYFLITTNTTNTKEKLKTNMILTMELQPIEEINITETNNEINTTYENEAINIYDRPRLLLFYTPSGSKVEYEQYNLIKLSSRQSISFTYIIKPNLQMKTPKMINLTSSITVLKFEVSGVDEIGGTLYMGFTLNPRRNVTEPYLLLFCVRRFAVEIPTLPNKCIYYKEITNASVILNSSSPIGTYENIHIPYPEIGSWYLSIGLFPYTSDSSIENRTLNWCSRECTDFFRSCVLFCDNSFCRNDCVNEVVKEQICSNCNSTKLLNDDKYAKNLVKKYNASVIFSLAMSPCIDESCGPHGECRLIADNTIMFSTCLCNHKYAGWDCSNDKLAQPKNVVLLEIILLTTSNLGFVGSVIFACMRQYYSEAIVYLLTMFFSIFYHACDAGNGIYSYCLVELKILKFCDFYSGLLSIWVTMLAMANLGTHLNSVCQMLGAILIAFGTTYNMEGALVFIIPATTGLLLIIVNWGLTCRETRHCFPAKRYLLIYFPIGLLMVIVGITSFAFLQTASNYKYTHSSWHFIMALCVIVLLPNRNTFFPKI